MGRIDAYAHALPSAFVKEMMDRNPTDALGTLANAPEFSDPEHRIADLDEFGIDRQVLSLARPGIWDGLDPTEALDLVRLANDGIREFADTNPDRFVPVATLPFVGPEYVDELGRCMDDLEMAGVQLFTRVGDRPADDPSFHPIYEAAERQGVPVWLHPVSNDWYDWPDEHGIDKMFGWPFDTAATVMRLALGGTLERYPDLDFVTHHMGGVIPHFEKRIESVVGATGVDVETIFERLRGMYVDTALNGAVHALDCGYSFYGSDTVVFATDYPFGRERGRWFMRAGVEGVDAMDISPSERERIYGRNVEALL